MFQIEGAFIQGMGLFTLEEVVIFSGTFFISTIQNFFVPIFDTLFF
jgi:xanthine dehydrogenase molybdopterin-binding subunit B